MDIKNCPKCKKIFSPLTRSLICPECEKKEEEDFNKVRVFLRENRGTDINVVAKETGVSVKKILQYLKDGRLEVSEGMGEFLKCEKCGVPIKSGQYCPACNQKMIQSLKSLADPKIVQPKEETKAGVKMHIKRN